MPLEVALVTETSDSILEVRMKDPHVLFVGWPHDDVVARIFPEVGRETLGLFDLFPQSVHRVTKDLLDAS